MPEQRELKQRIRARKSETGESYTAARRAVLAETGQPTLPTRIPWDKWPMPTMFPKGDAWTTTKDFPSALELIRRENDGLEPNAAFESRLAMGVEAYAFNVVRNWRHVKGEASDLSSMLTSRHDWSKVIRNLCAEASHLGKLAHLVFGVNEAYSRGTRVITCQGWDNWTMERSDGKKVRLVRSNPFSSDEEVVDYFRTLLAMPGIRGDCEPAPIGSVARAHIPGLVDIEVTCFSPTINVPRIGAKLTVYDPFWVNELRELVTCGGVDRVGLESLISCIGTRANILLCGPYSPDRLATLRALSWTTSCRSFACVEGVPGLDFNPFPFDTDYRQLATYTLRPEDAAQSTEALIGSARRLDPDHLVIDLDLPGASMALRDIAQAGQAGIVGVMRANDPDGAILAVAKQFREGSKGRLSALRAQSQVRQVFDLVVHVERVEDRLRLRLMALNDSGSKGGDSAAPRP